MQLVYQCVNVGCFYTATTVRFWLHICSVAIACSIAYWNVSLGQNIYQTLLIAQNGTEYWTSCCNRPTASTEWSTAVVAGVNDDDTVTMSCHYLS